MGGLAIGFARCGKFGALLWHALPGSGTNELPTLSSILAEIHCWLAIT